MLLPLDLLNLGRVNRALRRTLMSKGSRTAWKAARANADNLPEPFDGISEPAWVQLVFVRICQVSRRLLYCDLPDAFVVLLDESCQGTRFSSVLSNVPNLRERPVGIGSSFPKRVLISPPSLVEQNITVDDPISSLIPLTQYSSCILFMPLYIS